MTQDHIKLRWLQEFLEGIEFLKQYTWTLYTDEDTSESVIVKGRGYEVDLEYDIILRIQEYTRPASELRRILQHWLDRANPAPVQRINIQYKSLDHRRADIQATFVVSETQRDIQCDPSEAEGVLMIDGDSRPIKLDRTKPSQLSELEAIHCQGKHL